MRLASDFPAEILPPKDAAREHTLGEELKKLQDPVR